jgi:hypothetical protein
MSNFYNSNDFDVVDKKEKSKFIKMKSIFDMPTNKKYIIDVNKKEKELQQMQKDKEKIVNKSTNTKSNIPEPKQVSFKPNNNNNDSMLLINRAKHIKK